MWGGRRYVGMKILVNGNIKYKIMWDIFLIFLFSFDSVVMVIIK